MEPFQITSVGGGIAGFLQTPQLIPCAHVRFDDSQFADSLLQVIELVGHGIFINNGPVESIVCSFLILIFETPWNIPEIEFVITPNPKNKIIILTTTLPDTKTPKDFLTQFHRTSLLYIVINNETSEFYRLTGSSLMPTTQREAPSVFDRLPENRITYFNHEPVHISTFNCTVYCQVGDLDERRKAGGISR